MRVFIFILSWGVADAAMAQPDKPVRRPTKRFRGFKPGQSSVGFLAGIPTSVRYQFHTGSFNSLLLDVGVDSSNELTTATVAYSVFFMDDDSKWRTSTARGTSLYSLFFGALYGATTSDEKDAEDGFGLRVGGGFEYKFGGSSWAFRAEGGPVIFVSGDRTAGFLGGVGIMYYFGGSSRPRTKAKSKSLIKLKAQPKSQPSPEPEALATPPVETPNSAIAPDAAPQTTVPAPAPKEVEVKAAPPAPEAVEVTAPEPAPAEAKLTEEPRKKVVKKKRKVRRKRRLRPRPVPVEPRAVESEQTLEPEESEQTLDPEEPSESANY